MEKTANKIDIEKVIQEKSPRTAKLLPGFLIRYIKRILHQDYMNHLLKLHGDKQGFDFVRDIITEFNIKISLFGESNIPASGKYIFVSNHPLGGFDGLVLIKVLGNHYSVLKFLVNDVLLTIKNLESLFIPINKHGSHPKEAARLIEEAFQSEAQILTFPAGLVSRKIKGKIVDLEWKKNFVSKAIKHQRDVIPVFITGRNTNRFYTIAKLRKLLGIKWNIEMFYLADETYKHRNKSISLYFGKPIPWSTFDKSKSHEDWAEWVKGKVYALPENDG